jgi:hypothetical protein
MNQPTKETAKLLLQLIKPIAKKRMLEEQKKVKQGRLAK